MVTLATVYPAMFNSSLSCHLEEGLTVIIPSVTF